MYTQWYEFIYESVKGKDPFEFEALHTAVSNISNVESSWPWLSCCFA